jgi:hypothetical protein
MPSPTVPNAPPTLASANINNAGVVARPKLTAAEKFAAFMKILNGVTNLGAASAGIYAAIRGPLRNPSGNILSGGAANGLAAAQGTQLSPLERTPAGPYQAMGYESSPLKYTSSNAKDLLSLLKALGG